MKLLDGRKVSVDIRSGIKNNVLKLIEKGIKPCLGIILVGNRSDSETYVRMKKNVCSELNINTKLINLSDKELEYSIINKIEEMNRDIEIHGILIQLPLPDHINTSKVLSHISFQKDVEGFHYDNVSNLTLGNTDKIIPPCTPKGCIDLLDYYNIPIEGKNVTVIGKSSVVGLPLSLLFLHREATVTICHIKTKNLIEMTKNADILVVACGKENLIDNRHVKEGVVIIDVGINIILDKTKKRGFRVVGDVNFEDVKDKCSYITPVPGGVGPMTITTLLKNLVSLVSKNKY